jgi:hypothetical protein
VPAYGNSMGAAYLHEADRPEPFLFFEQLYQFSGDSAVPVCIQPFHDKYQLISA